LSSVSSRRRAALSHAAFEALEDRRLLAATVVSVVNGATGLGNATSREPSVSADGRYVVFSSSASNLVSGDANNVSDVFLRDTTNNTTTLISVAAGGAAAGNARSEEPSISADGRFVSFTSFASDLVGGDTNSQPDIFVRDVQAGTTRRVSADSTGPNFTGNPNDSSAEPFTSANGDFVAFTSRASDMVNGVTDRVDATTPEGQSGKVNDVFLRDLTSNDPATAVKMVSVNTAGNVSGNARSFDASVSADGRFVAFRSDASDLVGGDSNGKRDVFVRDMQAGVTTRISVATGGGQGNGDSDSPSISQDGRYIVFSSMADNLAAGDGNQDRDVFIHDRTTGTTTLVSLNQLRTASGNGTSFEPTISQEGRYVAFTSGASNLVTGDNNGSTDIFLYDVTTGAVNLISTNIAGAPAQGNSRDAFVAPGGQFIAFSSEAIDLVGGDNNGAGDAFLATAPNREADDVAPTAALATDQPSNFLGGDHLDFTVNYNDNDALNLNSFGDGDVEITGPGITSPVAATLVSKLGSGKTVKVTYRIAPAGGTVTAASNGAYTVTLRSGQVQDAAGNSAAPGSLGQVTVTAVPSEGPDIVVTIPGTLLPAVGGFKGKQKVLLQNTGTQAIVTKSKITVGLYLSTDSLLDASDTQVATKTLKFNAKPNARPKNVAFKFLWPRPGGTNTGFQLLAAADTTNVVPERSEQNNVVASPVTVADPFVDLGGSLGAVPTSLVAGQRVTLPFTIQNNGNIPAKGTISLKLLASADDELGGDTEIVTLIKKINLRPGKPRLLPLSFVVPSTIATGSYNLLVQIDSAGAIAETNEVNNVVVGSSTFSI
jgi:Tol biopolymer transport system component